ncbi:hypothetical protein KAFR_0G02805 [Kazachstania africana CBS 2517]|uniref:Temperature shock-inducible protein 1 n=1 Tax=Kazachstania africana (strain ATCC 22294 / BCRC 22015 / CBS 2517 / CECT 1963 / NBRC 1671 / NRRL Y-8276) TaxID=1071382 RepID=H2AY62_KAZAF|nr:hypothetical protein KAFR_0G02805 [Kazachstania africana CBS 2517]CCF59312.1 hypothetical protein KAFR_0G02805 [Kazachstania africana CBS 2517]
MNSKIAALLAITSVATAQTLYEIAELEALLDDLDNNLSSYIALYTSGEISFSDLPSGVLELAMAMMSATDSSYTTLFADVDYAGVESMITILSWYSSRLLPEIESIYSSELAASAAEASSTATSPAETSSAAASSAAETSSVAASSAAETSSVAASSAAETSSVAASSAAASTTSTAAIQVATANGAAKAAFGMGAGALAAAALLM